MSDPGPRSPDSDPRILLAAERTLLAWIRTGLTMMAFGFVVARFGLFLRVLAGGAAQAAPGAFSRPLGVSFVVLGALMAFAAARDHREFRRCFFAREPLPLKLGAIGVLLAGTVGAAGLGLAVYLAGT